MSDSNRGNRPEAIAAAPFCVIAAFGAVVLFYVLGTVNGREAERREQPPAAYSEPAKTDAQRACAGREPATMFECVYERVEASQDQAYTKQDLTAQQRAAASALAAAVISFLSLGVTIVGVWFVKRTLEATLEAVEDTGKATEAMVAQNLISQRALDALYLPRVHIRAFGPAVSNEDVNRLAEGENQRLIGIKATVILENLGNEPITLVMGGARAEIPVGAPIDLPRNDLLKTGERTLIGWGADAQHARETGSCSMGQFQLTQETRDEIMDHGVVISGRVFYKNVLDEIFEHAFAFRAYPIWASGEYQTYGGTERNYRRKVDGLPRSTFAPEAGFPTA